LPIRRLLADMFLVDMMTWVPGSCCWFCYGSIPLDLRAAGYSRCWGDSHLESRWGKGLQATNALNMEQFQLESRWGKGLQATNALNMEQFQLPTLAVSPVILSEDRKVLWDALSSQRLRIAIHGEFLKMRGPKVIQIFFPRFEKHSAHAFLILATLQKLSKHIKKYWFVTNYPHIPHSSLVSD